MEAFRQVIDSNSLRGIISLPSFFLDRQVEIIVSLKENKRESARPPKCSIDIEALLKGSITESLIGALSNSGIPLESYRAERLSKYECAD